MDGDGIGQLTKQLRDDPPPVVAGLADDHLRHLAEAVRHARHHQAHELETASERALEHMPRLLRGAVKKIIG